MGASSRPENLPKSPETWETDAIVVEKLHSLDDDNLQESAKIKLRNDSDDVTVDSIRDKIVFSKPQGFSVLEDLTDLRHKVEGHEHKMEGYEHKFAVLQNEISKLRLEKEGK